MEEERKEAIREQFRCQDEITKQQEVQKELET